MEQIDVQVKKWRNSFGIVLPRKVVESEKLSEGKEVMITVQSKEKTKVKDVFGLLKKELNNIDTQKTLKEVDRAFWSKD